MHVQIHVHPSANTITATDETTCSQTPAPRLGFGPLFESYLST